MLVSMFVRFAIVMNILIKRKDALSYKSYRSYRALQAWGGETYSLASNCLPKKDRIWRKRPEEYHFWCPALMEMIFGYFLSILATHLQGVQCAKI